MINATSAAGSLRPCPQTISTVVELNVGGEFYTTTLGTLIKFPGSKLADMFSSSAKACVDAKGRFFIDRPGTYFRPILEYLRSGQLPTQYIPEVYREAQFYDIKPLVKLLEDTPQIFGEQVARKQFVLQVPGYSENLELMVRMARAEAVAARKSSVLVRVAHTEQDDVPCTEFVRVLEANKKSVVKFGPWKAAADVYDLLHCVVTDIQAQGYKVSCDLCNLEQVVRSGPSGKVPRASYYRSVYTFTFTWW
ncbi:BTB/POZ domain-containing protein KCTD14 [Nycticebus coucang]|uniref:BTB/POZ domain-containing protein KCTD14 n=1 Tax=Nycticebus coucang TaxID=9470 RepID=UPI00234C46D1|nr:BTB/POZ domain-containing protein KCTD14 [Nycticebus coucang]